MIKFIDKLSVLGQLIYLVIIGIGAFLIISGVYSYTIEWKYIIVGLMILVPLFLLLKEKLKMDETESKNKGAYEKYVKEFKASADRIVILLDEAHIIENKRYQTVNVVEGNGAALNEIAGYGHLNEEKIEHVYCKVTFKINYHDTIITVKHTIHKDETTVRMYFYMQKSTTLYINPYDVDEFYLDMEFLDKT